MELRRNLVAGFNLHYIPPHMYRAFIRAHVWQVENARLAALKDPILKKAYRTYKVGGISQPRRIDVKNFLNTVQSFTKLTPDERETLILTVESQIAADPRNMGAINKLIADFLQQRKAPAPVVGKGVSTPGT
jgi:hypothetical protein